MRGLLLRLHSYVDECCTVLRNLYIQYKMILIVKVCFTLATARVGEIVCIEGAWMKEAATSFVYLQSRKGGRMTAFCTPFP